MQTLYNQYAVDLAEASSEETSKVTESFCNSHLQEELVDEASSYKVVTSSWVEYTDVAEVPRSVAVLRRSRRQSAAC